MRNRTTFTGGLVRKGKLQSKDGKNFIFLTLAKTYSKKQADGTYQDVFTDYVSCSASGRLAENIARAEFPRGTRLLATGTLDGRIAQAYTNKNGELVPEHGEEVLYLENLAPDLSIGNVVVSVTRPESHGTQATSTSAVASQNTTPDPVIPDFGQSTQGLGSNAFASDESAFDSMFDFD